MTNPNYNLSTHPDRNLIKGLFMGAVLLVAASTANAYFKGDAVGNSDPIAKLILQDEAQKQGSFLAKVNLGLRQPI